MSRFVVAGRRIARAFRRGSADTLEPAEAGDLASRFVIPRGSLKPAETVV